jgi:aspartate-semialdehyde dehydrogenase
MLEVLNERNFPLSELIPVASEKSVGKEISWQGRSGRVRSVEQGIEERPDLALFSAGGGTSLQWAPGFANVGCRVVDNSSAWRMDPSKKLIVPEINGDSLTAEDFIIANPNCSTIQMVMVLAPLHKLYTVKRVVVSTYQSVTGTGVAAVDQMMNERAGIEGPMAYKYPIDLNLIPQIDVFLENGYTKEEMKMVLETKKILGDDNIRVTATAVRVPVIGGHSESVNIEFEKEPDLQEIRKVLSLTDGIVLKDNIEAFEYPMPLLDAHNNDGVFVGRLRRDETQANTINCWIVSDNLRKGAATNAVQIAEKLMQRGIL